MKEDIKDPTFLSLTNLEKNTFQEWFDSWYGTADLEYGEKTSTFAFYQDNKSIGDTNGTIPVKLFWFPSINLMQKVR